MSKQRPSPTRRRNRFGKQPRANLLALLAKVASKLPRLPDEDYADVVDRFSIPPASVGAEGQQVLSEALSLQPFRAGHGQDTLVRDTVLFWLISHRVPPGDLVRAAVHWERILKYGREGHRTQIIDYVTGQVKSLRIEGGYVRRGLLAGAKGNKGFGPADCGRFIRECGGPGHPNYLGDRTQRFLLSRAASLVFA